MKLDPLVFRRYDIRGRAGEQIHEDLAYGVGRGLGSRIRDRGDTEAVVGRDVRPSSPGLAAAVARGLRDSGLAVLDLGIVPTPVVYHTLYARKSGGGVMVTGSHNPRGDNGLKMCLGRDSFFDRDIQDLRRQIESEDYCSGDGSVTPHDVRPAYLADLQERFTFGRKLKVAVDCGNGVMGPWILEALARFGHEVVPLYCEQDGDFPNHLPDPEVPKYMKDLMDAVVREGADCGLGFDGDGDRVGVIDENGKKVSADWLLALFAEAMLVDEPGGIVRYDVKCSDYLDRFIRERGGVPEMGETGHSILKRDVKARDAILGGELSGHIVINRGYPPIDDSLYCALFFLRILDRSGGPASRLWAGFPDLVSTPEVKIGCPDEKKDEVMAALVAELSGRFDVQTLDGARVRLEPGTWFLVRKSNTTPCLTVRVEADTMDRFQHARRTLLEVLESRPEVDAAELKKAGEGIEAP